MLFGFQTPTAHTENSSQTPSVFTVPERFASLNGSYWAQGTTLPEYILIQDVHKHPEVQGYIASLILYGYDHWGVKKVFMEGAFSSVDLSVFHRLPENARLVLLNRLVKEGNLSGPEMAAVLLMEREWRNPPVSPFQLIGIEDPALYRENLASYQKVMAHREEALWEIKSIERLQTSMQIPDHNLLKTQLSRTEALVRLKLTPAEYDEYLRTRAAIPSTPKLDPLIHAAEDFYRLVQLRSQVFLELARKKVPASTGPRVLVVGGFHTFLMSQELRARGRSFVVLAPRVTQAATVQDAFAR